MIVFKYKFSGAVKILSSDDATVFLEARTQMSLVGCNTLHHFLFLQARTQMSLVGCNTLHHFLYDT